VRLLLRLLLRPLGGPRVIKDSGGNENELQPGGAGYGGARGTIAMSSLQGSENWRQITSELGDGGQWIEGMLAASGSGDMEGGMYAMLAVS